MKNRIGIFSGTFDPVHEGHISFAGTARDIARLDEVIVIVERYPRAKRPVASFSHRLAMTRRAFETINGSSVRLSVGAATSFEDLRNFADNEVHLLVGSDVVSQMTRWKGLLEWAPHLSLIVGLRAGHDKVSVGEQIKSYRFKNYRILAGPQQHAASSIARDNHDRLLPTIASYVTKHRLYT